METIKKVCTHCGNTFKITEEEVKILEKLSPKIGWNIFPLDIPKICKKCRQRLRLAFRNERKFYNEICNKCGKKEISTISKESWRKILCQKCYNEEDKGKYYEEYNGYFQSSLFNLFKKVPYKSKLIMNMENSEYCNQESDDKNCYLNTGWHFNENSFYNTFSLYWKYTIDNLRGLAMIGEISHNSRQIQNFQFAIIKRWLGKSRIHFISQVIQTTFAPRALVPHQQNIILFWRGQKILHLAHFIFMAHNFKIASRHGLRHVKGILVQGISEPIGPIPGNASLVRQIFHAKNIKSFFFFRVYPLKPFQGLIYLFLAQVIIF